MSIKKQIPSLSKLYAIYEEVPENFWTKPTLIIIFTTISWTLPWSIIELFELAKVPTRNFAFKLFQFCDLKNQQRFILEEEVSVSLKELAAILNTLRQFLKQYDKAVKFPLYPLPKPKQEIGFTLFKDELFAHYFQDIKEHCNRQIRLSFRFERNKECCFSIKKFQIVGEQNVLTEIINLRHCEVYSLYKNRSLYCVKVWNCW